MIIIDECPACKGQLKLTHKIIDELLSTKEKIYICPHCGNKIDIFNYPKMIIREYEKEITSSIDKNKSADVDDIHYSNKIFEEGLLLYRKVTLISSFLFFGASFIPFCIYGFMFSLFSLLCVFIGGIFFIMSIHFSILHWYSKSINEISEKISNLSTIIENKNRLN